MANGWWLYTAPATFAPENMHSTWVAAQWPTLVDDPMTLNLVGIKT